MLHNMARTDSGPARTEWLTSPTARTARRRLRGRGAALLAGHGQRAEEGVHRAAPSLTGARRRPSQVLEGLSTAEGRQARVAVDEAADPDGCSAGVVPQGPADGLADEELRILLVGLDDVAQQARVGTVLVLNSPRN